MRGRGPQAQPPTLRQPLATARFASSQISYGKNAYPNIFLFLHNKKKKERKKGIVLCETAPSRLLSRPRNPGVFVWQTQSGASPSAACRPAP